MANQDHTIRIIKRLLTLDPAKSPVVKLLGDARNFEI